jgi:hypothetical protein
MPYKENNPSYDLNESIRPQVRVNPSCGYGYVSQNKEGCSSILMFKIE